MAKARNYKEEYERFGKKYEASEKQKTNRAARNKARRMYEKANGDLPSNVDVDHKRMLDAGGTTTKSNLRAVSQKANRGWRKKNGKVYG